MSFVLIMGWIVPSGTHSAYASQAGARSAEGVRIAGGAYHSILLKSNGTVVAWGNNNNGQLNVPRDLADVKEIAAGSAYSLALTSDGAVVAWGNNEMGQTTVPEEAVKGRAVSVAAGGNHSLALMSDGTVLAWGNNSKGQVNVLAGLTDVVAISAGFEYSLALKSDGTVVAWGGNSSLPVGLNHVVAISAGTYHSLALKSDGKVVAWGNNNNGQSTIPLELAAGGVIAIAAGDHHSLALKSDGTVVAWGDPSKGQLAIPAGLTDVVAISAGWDYSLALKSDGTVIAWGDNSKGQTNVPAGHASPIKGKRIDGGANATLALRSDGKVVGWGEISNSPAGLNGVVDIAMGYNHSLALKSDGTVAAWGSNGGGQINVPGGLDGVAAIDAGGFFSLALKSNGTVVGWGLNSSDQTNVPLGLNGVVAIAAGDSHSLALKSNGTVAAWGLNEVGEINVPADLDGVVAIAAGANHSLALKADGTVIAWGGNNDGQSDVPAGLNGIVAIAAGAFFSLALKSDGTVVAWGNNSSGQINVPEGLGGVVAISAGLHHSLALKADGTVVAWGDNTSNQTLIPGNPNLQNLILQDRGFTEPFNPSVTAYMNYYDGQSLSSVDVTPTLTNTAQTALYVNNELLQSAGTKTLSLAGAMTDTVIPVRVEPYLLPGRTYTITLAIDSTAPKVQFDTNGQLTASTSAASKVTVSDTQSGVDQASLQYAWTPSAAVPTNGWTAFNNEDTLSQTTGDGNWYLHIRATDAVGNTVDTVSNRFVLDNTAPTATLTSSAGNMVNAAFPVTITFNEGVSGFTEDDLAVTNGAASDLVSVSGVVYTAVITPTTSGQTVTVSVGADAVTDEVGHGNSASNTLTLQYDTTKPVVAFGGFANHQRFAVSPAEVSVTISEAVYWAAGGAELIAANALPLISMTKDGEAFSGFTPSYEASSRTFILSFSNALQDGVYEVNVAGDVVLNGYANTLDAASASFIVAEPMVSKIAVSPASLPSTGGYITATITGVNLTGQTVKVYSDGFEADTATVNSDTSAIATVSIPRNTARTDRNALITVYLNGVEVAGQSAVVTVSPAPVPVTTTTLSSNAELAKLSVNTSGGSLGLSPSFEPGTMAYETKTEAGQVQLQAAPAHSNAVVTLQGARIGESTTVPMAMGVNVLIIKVQAEDGTVKTYRLTITRVAGSEEKTSHSAPVCDFTDIGNHWAHKEICEAAKLGIVKGIDAYTFVPNGFVTRTEFSVMLLRALQIPISAEANVLTFGDKDNIPEWARSAIQTAVAQQVLTGYPDGTLRPLQAMNRAEMSAMVARAMSWKAGTESPFFSDDIRIPPWAKTYVDAVREHGIVVGRAGNEFQPDGLTTRAEAAVILLRLWNVLH